MPIYFNYLDQKAKLFLDSMSVSELASQRLFIDKLTGLTVPSQGGETEEMEVFDFQGAGGVALSMYNTDEVFHF